ncbi:unnamed protein product [Callosobruchus maculatus]|uniref:H15 domain-containing protein n=1 Tax=Callosobruchus maculatus TaxID=64391 RepID=A0A653DCP4_CALMS|nr:unnamed protein product [Callosobruchus maculatus]
MEPDGTMAARHHPRYLNEIMEVIVNMKEVKGSTSRRILDRVHNLLVLKRKKGKVDPLQIKKALAKGVEYGVLRKKDGKYRLGLDAKDYIIYRNWTEKHDRQTRRVYGAKRHRSGRRMRSRSLSSGRQRERRSSSSYEADDYSAYTDDKRDRKNKRTVQKKDSPKKGRNISKSTKDSRTQASVAHKSATSIKGNNNSRSKSRSASKLNNQCSNEVIGDRSKGQPMKDEKAPDNKQAPYCGNPECLCNLCMKQNETK